MVKQLRQKAAQKHHCYQNTDSAELASREGRGCPAPLAGSRVLVVLFSTWTPCSGPKPVPRQHSTAARHARAL